MTVTVNEEFNTYMTEPLESVFIDAKDEGQINLVTDTADVTAPGIGVYITGGTQYNDVTPCTAAFGSTGQQAGAVYLIDMKPYDPDFNGVNVHPPNSSFTLADYAHAANRPVVGRRLKKGMKVWMLMTIDATGAATHNETLIFTTAGFLARIGDPDGTAIAVQAFAFRVLATIESQNWVPVEVMEITAYDATP
jgi:hypothetical protein